jgi:hypothetical protein
MKLAAETRDPVLLVAMLLAALLGLGQLGCTPQVGDSCQLSTDCGATGNLVCDTSQFMGYCTQLNCQMNECPDNAACVLFHPSVPGCGFSDRLGEGFRVSQQFCMKTCGSDGDCRPGYVCAHPTEAPWFADILDNNKHNLVCIPAPFGPIGGDSGPMIDPDAPVCQSSVPSWDAFPPPPNDAISESAGQ